MAPTVQMPIEVKLANAWLVRPGDTLILGYSRQLNQAEARDIRERFRTVLPDIEIVIADSVNHMAVYKPEQPDDGR